MFQSYWNYALVLVLSIAPVVFMVKLIWSSHNTASSGNLRRIVTYLLGFAVTASVSVVILDMAFKRGLPIVMDLFANNPASAAINSAGLQLTGAIDNGSFSLPGISGEGGSLTLPALPALPSLPSVGASAPITADTAAGSKFVPASPAIATVAPVVQPTLASTVLTMPSGHDWASYTVRPGDSMSSIARRYGVSLADLCGMNRNTVGGNCNLIRSGQQLKLPASNGAAPRELPQIAKPVYRTVSNLAVTVQPTPVPAVKTVAQSGGQTYIIKNGDTIYTIANKFGGMGKVYDICTANRATLGDNCDNVQAGATIVIK